MKVIAKALLLSLGLGILAFAGGCGQSGLPAGKSPEDVIKAALLNQPDLTEAVFELTAVADLAGTVDGEENSLKGDFSLNGSSNADTGHMSIVMNIDADMNGEVVKGSLEVRANEEGVFVKIGNIVLSDKDSQELIELMLEDYLGAWVKISFVTSEELVDSGYADIDYDEGEPLPFKNIEYVGNTNILGVDSYHFTAEFDEEMLLDLMQGDAGEAQEFLEAATIKGDIYVAIKENVLTGFGGVMTLSEDEMKGTVELQIKINPTRSEAVTTPAYEKEFTEEDLGGLLFGGSMPSPEFDDSELADSEFSGDAAMDEEELAELMKMME